MTNRKLVVMVLAPIVALTGCEASNNSDDSIRTDTDVTATDINADNQTVDTDAQTVRAIDWSRIDNGQAAIDPATYDYPFAIDSQNVRDYADYFNVDPATAQHNMTVSMASNEALSKVLDQLGNSYVSHELIDGKDIKLIVHTTSDIKADSYDYIFAEDFAQGLVLPIEIKPDGVKVGDNTLHDEAP